MFSSLQLLAFLFAITISVYMVFLDRNDEIQLSKIQKILGWAVIAVLFLLGIAPDVFDNILRFFSFESGNGQRLIGLLVMATFVLFLALFRMYGKVTKIESTFDDLIGKITIKSYLDEYGDPETEETIYAIIPAYNEEENIGAVIERMPEKICGLPVRILCVVDGGTDRTEEVVRSYERGQAAVQIVNRGGGAALQVGFDIALAKNAHIIVTLDADGQHQPEEMEQFIRPILDGQADFVNGSRVLGRYEKDSAIRSWGVVFFNRLISTLMMTHITDCSNGYRAFTRDLLKSVRPKLTQRQYHTTEMLIEVLRSGFRFMEVPMTVTRRMSGESKKGPTIKYAVGFTRAILSTWLR